MPLQLTTREHLAQLPYDDIFRCKEYIIDALNQPMAQPTHTFMDIVEGIESGRYQFWPGKQSAIVSEIMVYPQRKGLHLFLGGGDLQELIEMQRDLAVWAKEQGLDHVSLAGRMGWERALRDEGWGKHMVLMTKEI